MASSCLINWLLFSTLLNVITQSTSDQGYLCTTDKEGFFTAGKRCFSVSFTDGVGEKERNSTKISQLNLQGLFYLLARRFYILPDVLLYLYLSITAHRTYSLAARFLFVCVANMFALMIKLELKASYS